MLTSSAHVLLRSLHTDAVARLVRDGQARRVQVGMRALVGALLGNGDCLGCKRLARCPWMLWRRRA